MKKLLLTSIITLFVLKIQCQSAYVPMPMQNCEWRVSHNGTCSFLMNPGSSSESYTVYPTTDTIIATKRYIKFYVTDTYTTSGSGCVSAARTTGYWGAVRQDTANQKVYVKLTGNGNEVLYYNFNLHKGDTMKTYLGYPNPLPYQIIDTVYNQSFSDGICRRVFRFKYPSNWSFNGNNYIFYNSVIEGIGFNTGFENTIASMQASSGNVSETYSNLLKINNQTILATSTNTCVQTAGLRENVRDLNLKIFPNPSNEIITISASENYNNLHFIIQDIFGNEVLSSDNFNINIGNLKNGIYFIKCVNTKTNEVIATKFIKN